MIDISIKVKSNVFTSFLICCIILLIPNIIYSQNLIKESEPRIIKSENLFELLSKSDKYSKYDYNGLRKRRKDFAYKDEIRRIIISDSLARKIFSNDTILVLSTYSKPLYLFRCIAYSYWMLITKFDQIGYIESLSFVNKCNSNKYASSFLQKKGLDTFIEEVKTADSLKTRIWYKLEVYIKKGINCFQYLQYELYLPVPSEFVIDSTDWFNLINDDENV